MLSAEAVIQKLRSQQMTFEQWKKAPKERRTCSDCGKSFETTTDRPKCGACMGYTKR